MKSGWWKLQFSVSVDGIEIDFDELPVELKRKIMKQISQGAVAGSFDTNIEAEPGDMEGVCPLCGEAIEYEGDEQMDGGGVHPWKCPSCGATGEEGYDEVFDGHHYNVRNASGMVIHSRGTGKEKME